MLYLLLLRILTQENCPNTGEFVILFMRIFMPFPIARWWIKQLTQRNNALYSNHLHYIRSYITSYDSKCEKILSRSESSQSSVSPRAIHTLREQKPKCLVTSSFFCLHIRDRSLFFSVGFLQRSGFGWGRIWAGSARPSLVSLF